MLTFAVKPTQNNTLFNVPYVQYSGGNRLLSPPECDALVAAMQAMPLQEGSIGTVKDKSTIDKDYRTVKVGVLPHAGWEWLYLRILERVQWSNETHFKFDLSGVFESAQFLEYTAPNEGEPSPGHYRWHTDVGPGVGSTRKISVVIQLSDPTEYDGCRLQLFDCRSPVLTVPEIGRGDMVVFPSYLPHQVTDITRGTRRALVLWVTGPSFR
jgi:PKHD-type hydroxylase